MVQILLMLTPLARSSIMRQCGVSTACADRFSPKRVRRASVDLATIVGEDETYFSNKIIART